MQENDIAVSELPLERLQDEVRTVAAHMARYMGRYLVLVAELDRRQLLGEGFRTLPDWLSYHTGASAMTSREHIRVARALQALPATRQALCHGELSYSKVRAITRVARPDTEAKMVDIARHATAAQVERIVAKLDRADAATAAERARQIEARRGVEIVTDEDGMVIVRARLAPEEGALFRRAMDAARRELWDERPGKRSGPGERADALALIADRSLSGTTRSGGERTMVMVHVDEAVLRDPEMDGESRIADGRSVPAETARRLACDASTVEVTKDGAVGRRTRVVSAALARALLVRDEGRCRFPGCSCRIVDAHHVKHWANGGATVLGNLASICRFHHTLVHEGGYRVEADSAGTFRFFRPDGTELRGAPPPAPSAAPVQITDEDVRADRHRLMSSYDGGYVDYGEIGAFITARS